MPKFTDILDEISMMLDTPDEELSDEQRALMDKYLDELASQEADKVDAIGQFFRLETSRAEALKSEADRLAARARSAKNRIDFMRARYLQAMQKSGLKKVRGSVYTMSIRASDVVQINDVEKLPEGFITTHMTISPNKLLIKDALKHGQDVPGAEMTTSYSLRVA